MSLSHGVGSLCLTRYIGTLHRFLAVFQAGICALFPYVFIYNLYNIALKKRIRFTLIKNNNAIGVIDFTF